MSVPCSSLEFKNAINPITEETQICLFKIRPLWSEIQLPRFSGTLIRLHSGYSVMLSFSQLHCSEQSECKTQVALKEVATISTDLSANDFD